MTLAKIIDTTLTQLEDWDELIRRNEELFFNSLFEYDDAILLDICFSASSVKCTFLVPSGATWTDSKSMEEFLKWVADL